MAGCLSGAHRITGFIDNWTSFWGRPDLLKRDGLHPSWGGAALTFTFTFSHLADAFIQSDLQLGST